jgi:hypothetical protein
MRTSGVVNSNGLFYYFRDNGGAVSQLQIIRNTLNSLNPLSFSWTQ